MYAVAVNIIFSKVFQRQFFMVSIFLILDVSGLSTRYNQANMQNGGNNYHILFTEYVSDYYNMWAQQPIFMVCNSLIKWMFIPVTPQ